MPQLNTNSRLTLISHLKCLHTTSDFTFTLLDPLLQIEAINVNCFLCRFLIVNNKYLNTLVLNSITQMEIETNFRVESTLQYKVNEFEFKHSNMSLILLSKVENLKLIASQSFKWDEITKEKVEEWTKMCLMLKSKFDFLKNLI